MCDWYLYLNRYEYLCFWNAIKLREVRQVVKQFLRAIVEDSKLFCLTIYLSFLMMVVVFAIDIFNISNNTLLHKSLDKILHLRKSKM
jgi:hypothetical protein